jgi:hypothetical protein
MAYYGLDSCGSGERPLMRSDEYVNEPSDCTETGEFLH